jgi:hypothetical protein
LNHRSGVRWLLRDDPARLPVAEDGAERFVLEFERQLVGETGYEPVPRIEA